MSRITLLGRPPIVKDFSGLRQVTRVYKVQGTAAEVAEIERETFIPFATADEEFPLALLTAQRIERVSGSANALDLQLLRVFQEFNPGEMTWTGNDQLVRMDDARTSLIKTYVCLATEAEVLAPAIGSVLAGRACANVQINKRGVGAEVAVTYISAGKLSEATRESNNGKLIIKTLTYFNEIPPTPAGFTLVDYTTQNPNGVPTYAYTFAKGDGVISKSRQSREDGLQAVTWVSLGTRQAPPGVVIDEDEVESDGMKKWTVTAMQSATGGSPIGVTFSYEDDVPFLYPGRAKVYTETVDGSSKKLVDLYLSPPVEIEIRGTITVEYTAENTIGALAHPKWEPTEWATFQAELLSVPRGRPIARVEGLRGYRAVSGGWVSVTCPVFPDADEAGGTIIGLSVYGGSTGRARVYGGPPNPVGNTYTLQAKIAPAFIGIDGTRYYRRVIVHATIPAQAALPV